jgi:acetylornithine deacetylase
MVKLKEYVDDINANLETLPSSCRGPCSKYVLPDEGLRGRLQLEFFDSTSRGIACSLDSPGDCPHPELHLLIVAAFFA